MKSVGNIIGAIGFIIVLIISIYIRNNDSDLRYKAKCKRYNDFLSIVLESSIQYKFLNPDHHMRPTIKTKDKKIDFYHDTSGFYEFVLLKDSIVKKKGQSEIKIYREGEYIKTFNIDFGCD